MLALVLMTFGGVLVWSLFQHQRTADELRLLNEGYLPLALTVGEAKATQAVFGTVVDRVVSEPDPTATQQWLEVARRVRPATVERALSGVERAGQFKQTDADRAALLGVSERLQKVRQRFDRNEAAYDRFFDALNRGDADGAEPLVSELRAEERSAENDLREARRRLQERIAAISSGAAEQESRAALLLGASTGIALLVGLGVIGLTYRMLSPLPRLQRRVEVVARGDLSPVELPRSDDELGRLADAFERMVAALRARDDSLKQATDRLVRSERLAAIGRMAAHVTHEVRNPLSSIGLNVELLEEELADNADTKALLRSIQREIDRLTKITEEYLGLARLPEPKLEPDDLGALVTAVGQFVTAEFRGADVTLEMQVGLGLPKVALDESQLRQAVLNLLRNAKESMPGGGTVRLVAEVARAGVSVRVDDEGCGMDAETKERIFDLFFTTKKGGTGLGLPLTQQIIAAHGGTLVCDSTAGGGTSFELWLPRAGAAVAAAEAPAGAAP